MIGQRRGGAQNRGDAVEQHRVALEQRQKLHARGLARQEGIELVEHSIGLGLTRERRQHQGEAIDRAIRGRAPNAAHARGLPASRAQH